MDKLRREKEAAERSLAEEKNSKAEMAARLAQAQQEVHQLQEAESALRMENIKLQQRALMNETRAMQNESSDSVGAGMGAGGAGGAGSSGVEANDYPSETQAMQQLQDVIMNISEIAASLRAPPSTLPTSLSETNASQ